MMVLFCSFPPFSLSLKKKNPIHWILNLLDPILSFFFQDFSHILFFLHIFFPLTSAFGDGLCASLARLWGPVIQSNGGLGAAQAFCGRGSPLSPVDVKGRGWASSNQLKGLQRETEVSLRKKPRPWPAESALGRESSLLTGPPDFRLAGPHCCRSQFLEINLLIY